MVSRTILIILMTALFMSCGKSPNDYPIKAIPFSRVQVNDDFWAPRLQTNSEITIPYAFNHYKESGLINNFRMAAGLATGEQAGNYPFDDTDVYKTIEGASHLLAVQHDPNLERFLDSLITTIAAAQEDDGYIYTARTNESRRFRRSMGETRWSRLGGSHELYNAGHLYEAAYAHFQATGSRKLLDVALKNADLILETFGPDKIQSPPGHQEIELGLVKLFRITGNKSYLDMAKYFLDERGRSSEGRELWGEYAQDHKPVVEQDEAVGHAVRAPYMYSAMTDIVALTGNKSYRKALDVLWDNVASKKLHVTGGVGAVGMGESFGGNYDLPNMTAYNETCSSIANIMWNQRMFLLTGNGQYIDVMERTLYNAFLSGISMKGNLFFYDNPLASRGQHQRTPWLYCACCISNLTRFFPTIPEHIYAQNEAGLFINLFVGSSAEISLKGVNIKIEQYTRHPWDGKVEILVNPDDPAPFDIYIRIPGWARNQPVPGDLYRFKE